MNSIVVPIFVTFNLDPKRFLKLNELSDKVIFSDNSTTKLSDTKLRHLNIHWNKMNLGYGGGANVGIEQAKKYDAEWIVILNQDLKITRKSFDDFCDILKITSPAIVGPFVGSLDEKRWTTILPSKQIDYISGGCIAIHRDVVNKVGIFYEPYFMYYEDTDYCIRAKKAGFPLIKYVTSEIRHDDKPSLGKGSFLYEYYLARNHLLFVERHAPFSVKFYEWVRFAKSYNEYLSVKNNGGSNGLSDYIMRRFGEKKYEHRS